MIYLDNAATTAPSPQVCAAMDAALREGWGNPESGHAAGRRARGMVEEARARVAELIGARPDEIYFTSGATESNNIVVKGAALAAKGRGGRIVISAVEHPSVSAPAAELKRAGFEVSLAPVNDQGAVDSSAAALAAGPSPVLVSVMLVNNETGAIQPVAKIAAAARSKGAAVHTDATQAVGKMRVDVAELGVDFLSLSAHKFHGPKGAGALFIRNGSRLAPLFNGGGQEKGLRSGTPNVPGIAGMGAAAQAALRDMEDRARAVRACRDRFEDGVLGALEGCRVNGGRDLRLHVFSNLSFDGVDGGELVLALDCAGVACSAGPACGGGAGESSVALKAMGLSEERIRGAVRFSFGVFNTLSEAEAAAAAVIGQVGRLRGILPEFSRSRRG